MIYSAVGTDFVHRNSNYSAEDWFPYHTNDGTTLTLDLEPSSGDGKILNCSYVNPTMFSMSLEKSYFCKCFYDHCQFKECFVHKSHEMSESHY